MKNKKISRRSFIGKGLMTAVGAGSLISLSQGSVLARALSLPSSGKQGLRDYKALVYILLSGGNDSFNMLVPNSTSDYNEYQNTRSNLALPISDLLSLNYTDANGKTFGVHPSMPEVQQLFNNGKLAFLANTGTLVEPTTKPQFINNLVQKPLGLLSHSDQSQQWQTSMPHIRSARGWGGRMADVLSSMNTNSQISMNISLAGTNVFQAGEQTNEFAIQNFGNGSVGINVFESGAWEDQILHTGVEELLNQQYDGLFKETYRNKIIQSQQNHTEFSSAIAGVPAFTTQFSETDLSASLHMVAKTIAAQNTLGINRQVFFVEIGGWDHHDEVLNRQTEMLAVVSAAMNEFQQAMEEISYDDRVIAFTNSEFGRTLTSNGNGSDHAWGGNVMIMGGSINGGQIYGEYPSLALNSDLELGGGILIPTTSTDEYFAELALWLGVQPNDLSYVLPNINNFYTPSSASLPLGFLNI